MTTENKYKFGINILDYKFRDIRFVSEVPIKKLDPDPNPYPNPYFLTTHVHPTYKVSRSRRIALKNIYKFKN